MQMLLGYQTAVEISKQGWPLGSHAVVLARGDEYADALAGVPLAYQLDAPILLSPTQYPNSATMNEILRLGAEHVVILGGEKAISSEIESILLQNGLLVDRISGANRYQTAAEIAKFMNIAGISNTAVIAVGSNFPDALAAAAYAAQNQQPILLVSKTSLPDFTKAAITSLGLEHIIIAGGTGVITETVSQALTELATVERVSGSNRYSTAVALADRYALPQSFYFVATGRNFPDAITGAVLVAKKQSGVLLVNGVLDIPDAVVQDFSRREDVHGAALFGGSSVISNGIEAWFQTNL